MWDTPSRSKTKLKTRALSPTWNDCAKDRADILKRSSQSRTMKGGGTAGVVTLGAAGVEVAQSVLAETQSAILPLVPYLDTLRWVFIAVALVGIAVTIYARLDDWRRGQR